MMPWPTLPLTSWLEAIFKKTCGQPVLGGIALRDMQGWQAMLRDFWAKFKAARGEDHQVFTDHVEHLGRCIPVMIHGDEGRGKLRRAVMATSVQPAILPEGHAGHSFNSRLLHSIMPGELYEGDHTVQVLQEALVEDLRQLYTNGFEAPWMLCGAFYYFLLLGSSINDYIVGRACSISSRLLWKMRGLCNCLLC